MALPVQEFSYELYKQKKIAPWEKRKNRIVNIPLHEGTQSHVKRLEQFEAFHPNSKSVLLHLGKCKAGWFSIRTTQNPFL